ncbi:ArsR/SmtB family transcription factor [Altericista sp. CCNU0014]|uniref:ArsR/SmtB family transcription factor n=1 Tax=Altericista sp. CCNU0014 TaxID=3082949 RepID=UPI00384AAAAC
MYHPDRQQITLSGVLYALGDPIRLAIVRQLATKGEQNCCDFEFAIARSTMSHHFKILRESGVVLSRKSGTQHLNSLRRQELDELFPGLLAAVLQSAV